MARKLSNSTKYIGMWNADAVSDIKKTLSLSYTPIDFTKDQLIQLYILLYPFISADFSHRHDIAKWAEAIASEFSEVREDFNTRIQEHKHIGNLGSPTTTPISDVTLDQWEALPEDADFKYGEKLITGSSSYSSKINHRSPKKDSEEIKREKTKDIAKSYKEAKKLVPFDLDGNLNTGDDDFANDNNE